MRKTAYVFPGQGAQWVGMGYDLYKSSRKARDVFDEADEALGFFLSRLCFEGTEEELRQTINAQPAILATSIAYLRADETLWKGDVTDVAYPPTFLAGHSLGEYTALVPAKVLSFSNAIKLAYKRGQVMHKAGQESPGGMLAIIGLDKASVEEVCQESGMQIANYNSPEQIVISGPAEKLITAEEVAKRRGARRVIPLQVSGAFHSTLMQPTVEAMSDYIAQLDFHDPVVPIIANTTGEPLTTATAVRKELITQLRYCIQWQSSVEYMINAGASIFIEIGPGQVLSGLIKRINKTAQVKKSLGN